MRERFFILVFTAMAMASAGSRPVFSTPAPAHQVEEEATPEAGGEHLRVETEHGPLHFWHPAEYDASTAGMVIYIHGYFTSVDQTWTDDRLASQFRDSSRNALFIAIEAPRSSDEDVFWNSLDDLLHTIEERTPFPLPRGPLVVVSHSGGYRTILKWLEDPRLQYVILLDGLYGGQAEFRYWLRPHPRLKPRRMVLVASDTLRRSNRFARRIYGTARRRGIPAKASSFTPREAHARLLYIRSQYDHTDMVNNGKVIPVLLQITPIKALAAAKPHPAKSIPPKPSAPAE
ncbi:MAG: hypothetical protein WAO35_14995 [Terriglobia bacterium]